MNALDILKYGDITLRDTLARVPTSAWQEGGVCGVWSVRDIVAHLASYELLLMEVLGSLLKGQATPLLDHLLETGLAFNDIEVGKRQDYNADDALAEYSEAHEKVMKVLPQMPAEMRVRIGTLPWYGREYSLDDFLVYMYYGHKREHSAQIAVFADKVTQPSASRAAVH